MLQDRPSVKHKASGGNTLAGFSGGDGVLVELIENMSLPPLFAQQSCICLTMPQEKGGHVLSDLLVHESQKQSIIDGSTVPVILTVSLQASLYSAAEETADIIKARRCPLRLCSSLMQYRTRKRRDSVQSLRLCIVYNNGSRLHTMSIEI